LSDSCELCRRDPSGIVVVDEWLRIVLVDDPDYPGYARVIWNEHVREMTDLDAAARARLMAAVFAVETAVRTTLDPLKVNVASLGNVTPHLHWHVIPRFADDAHYPAPIWSAARRNADHTAIAARKARIPALSAAIVEQVTLTR
jgi:diadenosine tetraphosphate (Ap4A) HIT family hydrolase